MSNNILIYGDGLFEADDSYLTDLVNSGVNTIPLWSLHVHPNADLFYNNNMIVSNGKINFGRGKDQINPNMPADVKRLQQAGITVLFSIGAGGGDNWTPDDFTNIQKLLNNPSGRAQLAANFTALAQGLGLDGFDYDCEEVITVDTITALTQILVPLGRKSVITFCPYGDPVRSKPSEQFWLDCMRNIYRVMRQTQPVKWWSLQYYGNGDPAAWIPIMQNYINVNPVGVTDANSFIFPGLSADDGPQGVQSQFAMWQQQGLKLQGGFIWNLSAIYARGSTPAAYVKAITSGLAGQKERAA